MEVSAFGEIYQAKNLNENRKNEQNHETLCLSLKVTNKATTICHQPKTEKLL